MNYQKHYNSLIERGKNRILKGYSERHHVVPKCMGGTNDISNLVRLTPEEHYVAHQLLVKMYPENYKLVYATIGMCANNKHSKQMNNKLYSWLRKKHAKNMSNRVVSEETLKKMSESKKGKCFGHLECEILCLNNNIIYKSQSHAARELGLCQSNIYKVCKGHRNHTKGYKFKYASDTNICQKESDV